MSEQREQGGGLWVPNPDGSGRVCVQATQYVEFASAAASPIGGVDFDGLLQFDKADRGLVFGIHTLAIHMLGASTQADAAFSIRRLSMRSYTDKLITRDIHLAPPTRVVGVFIERFAPPWRIPQSLERKVSMGLRWELNLTAEVRSGLLAVGLAVYHDGRWYS